MSDPLPIVLAGEGMLEMSRQGDHWHLGYGGDTLNTAVHLARMGLRPAYLTAVGEDPFSEDLRAAWRAEGIDTRLVLADPNRQAGFYAIRTDAAGERSFYYWRDGSAATRVFDLPAIDAAVRSASKARLLVFSLISLAILDAPGRQRLLDLAQKVRSSGGLVAFDGNYRPKLWRSREEAVAARDAAIACCDIGLPTLSDEQALSGLRDASEVASFWRSSGAAEVVVKMGEEGCLADGEIIAPSSGLKVIDTSGAGDAFNAGYLAGKLNGASAADAAKQGNALAGWVIGRSGAIPANGPEAPYAVGRVHA